MATLRRYPSLLLAAVMLAALCLFGCGRIKETPNHLVGTWKSDAARYKDRYLKFTPTTMTFGTGEETSLSYAIKYLKADEKSDRSIVYAIKYEDMYGEELDISILYSPKQGGTIRVGHIDATWHKAR